MKTKTHIVRRKNDGKLVNGANGDNAPAGANGDNGVNRSNSIIISVD
jgi:hypothetical protein